ncbi:unnamed protein product [Didymodactylos carnosus]|uniref:Uncharacterized protein n=1 Tax=Didymodactylos carnosus TaxID=1234261 RepID=A0A814NP21_9BILA|nr:unnamed protein product [Didymodactylos carnosus]CAF3861705.1 unnamed protein product [Didymodactylos carnosus]
MIMLILLSSLSSNTQLKTIFLNRLYDNYFLNYHENNDDEEQQHQQQKMLTIDCMKHYLRMIETHRYQNIDNDLFYEYLEEYSIELQSNIEGSLDKLCEFLNEVTTLVNARTQNTSKLNSKRMTTTATTTTTNSDVTDNQQYFISLDSSNKISIELLQQNNDIDIDGWCKLLNIFNKQLPLAFQILCSSTAINNDIALFFSRIRTYVNMKFVIIDIDKMDHRIGEIFSYKQDELSIQTESHAKVFYISEELSRRKGIRQWTSSQVIVPDDHLQDEYTIYFNISIHAPFEQLNRLFFSLFICSTLMDPDSGLTFSLSHGKLGKFIIEVSHFGKSQVSVTENFECIFPLLSILCSNEHNIEEITDTNYPLNIGDNEELAARFLKAFADGTISRTLTRAFFPEQPVVFSKLEKVECYTPIRDTIQQYAFDLSPNKIYQQCFVKFLYRRVQFFTSTYYCYTERIKNLGSTVMRQVIEETRSLVQIDFTTENYRKVYLVYDPNFSLKLLHADWNAVPSEIQELFDKEDPMNSELFQNKDRFCVCLSWLLNVFYETYQKIANEIKFITTESIAYKLFHLHERKLMRMPLIIEGDTGKTELRGLF